jgi:hypothetical protein
VLVLPIGPLFYVNLNSTIAVPLASDPICERLLGVLGENPEMSPAQQSGMMWGRWWGRMMHAVMNGLGHETETPTKASSCTATVTVA